MVDAILQKEGFNLKGWDANGLTRWAVTDAEPEALKMFVELEKQRMAKVTAYAGSGSRVALWHDITLPNGERAISPVR